MPYQNPNPNVIIIGGGLTGISAAWELENLGVDYTLIEVKPRLGGAIMTEKRGGFIMDGTAFVIEKYGAWDFLEPLGLSDAMRFVGRYRDGRLAIFKDGTQALIDAITSKLTHPILYRMAVSSVGKLETNAAGSSARFGVCLENGLLMDASALIITVPARYAGHLLYSLDPTAALLLDGYEYDSVARVHLGIRAADLRDPLPAPAPFKYLELYTYPDRVPDDYALIRAGVRVDTTRPFDPAALVDQVKARLSLTADPVVQWVYYWAEADPLTRHLPEHLATMDALDALLPPTVALVGSDYRAKRLEQQVDQGRAAARRIAAALTGS